MNFEILESTSVKALGIDRKTCERYTVPQVKSRFGIKLGAVFAESCIKILAFDGSYFWEGEYDANLGLFGQKAIVPGSTPILVASDLEALRLASAGYDAICLAEPKATDLVTLGILADNLKLVTKKLLVWNASTFRKRSRAMDKFLLYLAGTKDFELSALSSSEGKPPLALKDAEVKDIAEGERVEWRPAGIKTSEDLINQGDFLEPKVGVKTGYTFWDAFGFDRGAITTITGGSGIAKTTVATEIVYNMVMIENVKCGLLYLEEKAKETLLRLAAIHFSIPVADLRRDPTLATKKQWDEFNNHPRIRKNLVFNNHFGSLDSEELFNKIDYMVDFCECQFVVLDHISIAVSGMSSKEGERKDIDILMTRLASMVVAKDFGMVLISHLSNPEGKPHEEGGKVSSSHLRGSGSIKQLSFSIYSLERNQQDPNSTRMLVRSLKGRWNGGRTGAIGVLNYVRETGRTVEDTDWSPEEFERMLMKNPGRQQGNQGPGSGNMRFKENY